jgi:hypothetical protein
MGWMPVRLLAWVWMVVGRLLAWVLLVVWRLLTRLLMVRQLTRVLVLVLGRLRARDCVALLLRVALLIALLRIALLRIALLTVAALHCLSLTRSEVRRARPRRGRRGTDRQTEITEGATPRIFYQTHTTRVARRHLSTAHPSWPAYLSPSAGS